MSIKKENKKLRMHEVMARTGFHRRRLKLWEKYGILNPSRAKNLTADRLYSEEDVQLIIWADGLMRKGLSAESIKILKEYFETGKISSFKWYK